MWFWNLLFVATAVFASPDCDEDARVGLSDFIVFANAFGAAQGDTHCDARADLNGDEQVDFDDFVLFSQSFGKEVASPAVEIPERFIRRKCTKMLEA